MSSDFFDVIIVGAGPAGSCAAYELAAAGHSVGVFEEKTAPGLNVCCTGIISAECFRSLDLSPDVILTKVNAAKFFSPAGKCLRLHTENLQAYVVHRLLLDKSLAYRAQSRGAQYFFSSPVIDIIPRKDAIQAETIRSGEKQVFAARALILANGFRPKLPWKLGLGKIRKFLVGAQAEIEAKDLDEPEIYFGHNVAPGSFAWLVPISANKAYVGLLSESQTKLHLQNFLKHLFEQHKIGSPDVKIQQRAIPIRTLRRSYGDRLLVIGDAAGQVKPTTGGGIYFGHLGARIAARVLNEALDSDNLTAAYLSRYQTQWKARLGYELSSGYWVRWAYSKLNDRQIEGIFNALASRDMVESLLNSGRISFDWHNELISTVLRQSSAYPWLKIRHLFSREASS